jgi:hypothetical protein
MTRNEARSIIHQEFKDNWSVTPAVPYVFDNEDKDTDGLAEWIHVSVQHFPTGGQITLGALGNRIFRRRAVVRVQVYAAVDRGLLRLDELTTAVRDIFEAKTISQVMFHDSNIIENGREDNWEKGTVNIFFTYDETR